MGSREKEIESKVKRGERRGGGRGREKMEKKKDLC